MMIPRSDIVFDDQMGAGRARFVLNYPSLYHLARGGTRLILRAAITIWRVILWLDVSKWQGVIDFVVMRDSGVHGVIIKCGQGAAKDPKFDVNWAGAKSAGIPRGSYWFYDSRIPPKEQAYNWWQWIKADRGELMHFADYEESYGGAWGGWRNFKVFLEEFQRLSNLPDNRIGIYTGYFYWIAHSPTTTAELAWFARFTLWLAWYTANPNDVVIPRPWTNAILEAWQYGTPPTGRMRGCESLDVDENNGNYESMEAYKERFGLNDTIPPPPNGEPMDLYGTATGNITIRTGPGTGYPLATINGQAQYVLTGDKVWADNEQSGFWHITRIQRAGVDVPLAPVSWCGTLYIHPETPPPPDPEPGLPEIPYRIELGDDISYIKQVIVGTLKPKI